MSDGQPSSGVGATGRDEADLAAFGYRQRLDRRLGGFSSFAAGFSYLSILTGLPQLFYLGFAAGGPAFFWTWPAVLGGQLLVACCFAELAAEFPLSGGVYQWAGRVGGNAAGWMAGWIALACAVVSMASVALALQGTLPQVHPAFQRLGAGDDPVAVARNAVALGCGLIALCTLVNVLGVRLLATINDVGVMAELAGAVLLVALLFFQARRGPAVVLDTAGRGMGRPLGYLGPALAAALTATFTMYGFDTAGSLAEETVDPRRWAPRAILGSLGAVGLVGALLILGALMAAPDLADPGLGRLGGGMPAIIRGAVGPTWGRLLLVDVTLAIAVCTLTVQASAVRLVFAMARDGGLPWSGTLARLGESARSPRLPALVVGAGAAGLLVLNADSPSVVELLASVAIAWANLGYLFVTVPQLARRLRPAVPGPGDPGLGGGEAGRFQLGRWGLPINILAVVWGLAVVVNVGWPRATVYGPSGARRFVAIWATLALVGAGLGYRAWARRGGSRDILVEHRASAPGIGSGRAAGGFEERR